MYVFFVKIKLLEQNKASDYYYGFYFIDGGVATTK